MLDKELVQRSSNVDADAGLGDVTAGVAVVRLVVEDVEV